MKRHLFLAAALTGTLALAGCDQADDGEQNAPADTATQNEQADTATATRNDQAAGDAQAQGRTLEGMLEFAATDTPLPEDARVTVSLRDVALADAPATVIAETQVDAGGNAPVAFAIDYPLNQVDPGHAHALHAEVRDADGQLQWISPARHSVEVGPDADQGPITLVLEPVERASALETADRAVDEAIERGTEAAGQAVEDAGEALAETADEAAESLETAGEGDDR